MALYPHVETRTFAQGSPPFGQHAGMTGAAEVFTQAQAMEQVPNYGIEGYRSSGLFDRATVGPQVELPALLESLIEQERRKVASLLPPGLPPSQLASLLGNTGPSLLNERRFHPPQDENMALFHRLLAQEESRSSQRLALRLILDKIAAIDPSVQNLSQQIHANMMSRSRPSTAQEAIARALHNRMANSMFHQGSATSPELIGAYEHAQMNNARIQLEESLDSFADGPLPASMEQAAAGREEAAPSGPAAVDAALALALLKTKQG